jgi:hypothetical protein
MTRFLDPTTENAWRHFFGKRYVWLDHFRDLCDALGLRSCSEWELEEYEREGWLFPAARLIVPEAYAQADYVAGTKELIELLNKRETLIPFHNLYQAIKFQIDGPDAQPDDDIEDLKHPIDQNWGKVEQLLRPLDQDFAPWESYRKEIEVDDTSLFVDAANTFYHYWQVYAVYQIRRNEKCMYRDNTPFPLWRMNRVRGDYLGLARGLEAVSQFGHLLDKRTGRYYARSTPNEDQRVVLTDADQAQLEEFLHRDAQVVCQDLGIEEEELYDFLRRLMVLHHSYELSERVKLVKALEVDLWRTVELIGALTGSSSEKVAERAGQVQGFRIPYLEVLFPNRRQQAREKSLRILTNLAQEYNRRASNYAVGGQDLKDLLKFAEEGDLALFEFILVEMNDAFFAVHSWRTAASYLALKSLASLPESLIRTVIEESAGRQTITQPHQTATSDLYNCLCFLLSSRERGVWKAYEDHGLTPYRRAEKKAEFSYNLAHLAALVNNSQNAEQYLSANMTLATLLRNFTSHYLPEEPELLQGQYLRSVRAIVATILFVWKTAQQHGLL